MPAPVPAKKQPIPFGKYLLLDRINIGGMAEVWRGKTFGAGGFERLVAIKRILPNIAEDEEFITMFIDEAKITVQLTHANIAQIYELGHISNSYFIAMEYIAGKDLRAIFDRCRKKGEPCPVPLTCYVMSKACEGLDYAHRKKDGMGRDLSIVHRDISPQNILISYEGEVKVIDFGIAKAAGKASKTQAGILKGKFGYMSPEQIRGLPLDRRSDVFAAGVCLYEMLTGERLFVGESDFSVLEKVRKAEVLPPSTYNRRIPEALEKIVLKALAKDVDDRYQYGNELADDLQRFLITSDSIFSRRDLMQYMKSTFAEEVEREKARLAEYVDVKPPPGMLAAAEAGYGGAGQPPPPPPRNSESLVALTPIGPPGGSPATVPAGRGPPVLSAAGQVPGRRPSMAAVPKLTVAALTPKPENENQSTMLIGRNGSEPAGPPMLGDTDASHTGSAPGIHTDASLYQTAPGRNPGHSPPHSVAAAHRRASMVHVPVAAPDEPPDPTTSTSIISGGRGKTKLVLAGLGVLAVVALALTAGLLLRPREQATGLILVEVPSEARGKVRVNINGDEIREADGTPPREWPLLRKVRPGKVMVLLNADGYEPFREQVVVAEGQEVTTVNAKLHRAHSSVQLVVVAEPASAEIQVDAAVAKAAGTPGSYVGEIATGAEHRIAVKAPGYKPFERKLTAVETGAAVTVTAKLEPLVYLLKVSSEPAGATVFVGETNLGPTPSELKVTFAVTELVFKKHCFETTTVAVKLPPEPKDPISVAGSMKKQPNCQ